MARRVRPRVEARTTEFDCRGIAELLDAQAAAPTPIDADLEADIEIGAVSTTTSPGRPSRLAHTLRRDELARGSQPIAIAAPVPDLVIEVPEVRFHRPLPAPVVTTTTMPAVMATTLARDSALVPAPSSRIWWIVAVAAFVLSGLALIAALRA